MQIPVEAVLGASAVIGGVILTLNRLGLMSFGKNGKGDKFIKALCDGNHEKLTNEIKARDDKYEVILHENHTTQQLILQRLEQTEKRFESGNDNFKDIRNNINKLYEVTQAQNTSIALLNQSMQQIGARVCSLEHKRGGDE